MCVAARADEKPCVHLPKNAESEVCCGDVVHRDSDDAAIGTSEKCGDPGRGVWSPEHDPITFANATGSQLASETECEVGDLSILQSSGAVALMLAEGLFRAEALEIKEIIGDAGSSHQLSVNHLAVI